MADNTHFKTTLEAEFAELTKELETIATYNPETGDWVAIPVGADIGNADENVTADTTEEWNERRALLGQLETRFNNLKKALDKFSENTFGICEICNEPIEPERLAANAAARTCKLHIERERELPL